MKNDKAAKKEGTSLCKTGKNGVINYIIDGQDCPFCSFAKLQKYPGNIIKRPVCGWGVSERNT